MPFFAAQCKPFSQERKGKPMGTPKAPRQLAKTLSYILGYRPDEFGLVLSESGFVKIKDLIKAICEEEGWRHIRRSHIDEMLYTLPDPPVEADDTHIRAKRRERLRAASPAENPPKLLYTAIRRRAHLHTASRGISPGALPHVVLSSEPEMALRIGKRVDRDPVMLTVRVQEAIAMGTRFLQAGESLFLAEFVHSDCFSGPPLPKETPEAAQPPEPKPAAVSPTPGSFPLDLDTEKKRMDRSKRKKRKEIQRKRERSRKRKGQEEVW